jgi:hypothetical protein
MPTPPSSSGQRSLESMKDSSVGHQDPPSILPPLEVPLSEDALCSPSKWWGAVGGRTGPFSISPCSGFPDVLPPRLPSHLRCCHKSLSQHLALPRYPQTGRAVIRVLSVGPLGLFGLLFDMWLHPTKVAFKMSKSTVILWERTVKEHK